VLKVGNYIYCAGEPGLQTVDVSDPLNLVLTDDWYGNTDKLNGLGSKDGVLYAACWSPNIGLKLFNLSADPAHPAVFKTISTTSHTWDIEISGNLMFVSLSNGLDPPNGIVGINIYDITNASNPVLISFIDAGVRLVGNAVQYGDYLYFTSKKWLNVYSISNPSSPQYIRRLSFAALAGTCRIHGSYLYMSASDYPDYGNEGGIYTFSLADPSNPQQVDYRDIPSDPACFTGDYAIGIIGSTGGQTLDASDPTHLRVMYHWQTDWPGTGDGGIASDAAVGGTYFFVGTGEDGFGGECPDWTCPYFGARVYSIQFEVLTPPIIAEVQPDPETVKSGRAYSKQLTLLGGTPLPTWSVIQGPPGTQVDGNGLVSGWTPAGYDAGTLFSFQIRATNTDGWDDENWQMRVQCIADFDHDDDVDQVDFGYLQQCMSGAYAPPPGCEDKDLNGDGYVDRGDFDLFANCLNGPNRHPGC